MAVSGTTASAQTSPSRPSGSDDLYENYFQWFRVCLATTPQELEEAYRLRYQVYCVETGFLPVEDNPGGLERDSFDDHSDQGLLMHRPTGLTAGCVRLVNPNPDKDNYGLPAIGGSPALEALGDKLPLATTGEISRFSVSKAFRQRQNDNLFGNLGEEQREHLQRQMRRAIPHITLGLMQCIVAMTLRQNLTHWCAIIDPLLLRLLSRLGIHFHHVGELVEFHGLRQPVYSSVDDLMSGIYRERQDIWEVLTDRGDIGDVGRH